MLSKIEYNLRYFQIIVFLKCAGSVGVHVIFSSMFSGCLEGLTLDLDPLQPFLAALHPLTYTERFC